VARVVAMARAGTTDERFELREAPRGSARRGRRRHLSGAERRARPSARRSLPPSIKDARPGADLAARVAPHPLKTRSHEVAPVDEIGGCCQPICCSNALEAAPRITWVDHAERINKYSVEGLSLSPRSDLQPIFQCLQTWISAALIESLGPRCDPTCETPEGVMGEASAHACRADRLDAWPECRLHGPEAHLAVGRFRWPAVSDQPDRARAYATHSLQPRP
jgi:hypothetical protein